MPDGATPADPPASPQGLTGSAAAQRQARLAKVEALRAGAASTRTRSRTRATTRWPEMRDEFGSLGGGRRDPDTVVHVAGRVMLKRDHGGLVFMRLKDESGFVQIMASRAEMGDAAFADVGRHRHRRLDGLRGPRRGEPQGRALGAGHDLPAARQGDPAAAGEDPPPDRHRDARAPALPRPDRDPRRPPRRRRPHADARRHPRLPRRAGVRGGRDAGAPARVRRRHGAALHHPPQRARHRDVPAHRPRAAPEAADRGRLREGLRDVAASSATRASTRATTPSSRCSRPTRRSRTTRT